MLLLIDTCFWNHSYDLYKEKIIDIRPIILKQDVALTKKVIEENDHYNISPFVPSNDVYIIPISDDELEKVKKPLKHLDPADRSLIIASYKKKKKIQ